MMYIEPRIFYQLDSDDFDELVQKTCNAPEYESIAEEEWGNHESHVCMAYDFDNDEKHEVTDWMSLVQQKPGIQAPDWRLLLGFLQWKGILPPGNYIIGVWW